eukprot:TRINITY_DN361_c0_g1_i1.p1 TRINITY_DN361_c0_g1~~TRINITY_DN361_c0_g1_i1.p1  ORF type:complete len:433 (-),score=149.62 TRINITY_DN361_c0_g1_i1:61-1359(-)
MLLRTSLLNSNIIKKLSTQSLYLQPYCVSKFEQPTFDFKRLKAREGWLTPEPEDPDVFVVREGLGEDSELNWTINGYQITPVDKAYRNLHRRGLSMLLPGTLNESKANVVDLGNVNNQSLNVSTQAKKDLPKNITEITKKNFQEKLRNIRYNLSFEPSNLFVSDGAIGSHYSGEVNCRVISDDPVSAMTLNHLLNRVPLVEAKDFKHEFTFIISTTLAENFIGIDLDDRTIISSGPIKPSVIQTALRNLFSSHFEESDVSLLPFDAIVSNNKTTLVFNENGNPTQHNDLYAASDCVLTPNGVGRAWSGQITNSQVQTQRGDLIAKCNSTQETVTSVSNSVGNIAPNPSSVIFVLNDASLPPVSTVTSSQASKIFNRHINQVSSQSVSKFTTLLDKTPAFVINGSDQAKVPKYIDQASSNKVKKALDKKKFSK